MSSNIIYILYKLNFENKRFACLKTTEQRSIGTKIKFFLNLDTIVARALSVVFYMQLQYLYISFINYYFLKINKLTQRKDKANNKIITFDIETILKDNVHKPYLYSMFDGKDRFSWFTNTPDSLFNQLLKRKYKGFIAYAHNLSRFDIVFLFNHLSTLKLSGFKVKILKKEEQIISINISNRQKNISLTIRDSYLLLPSSLSKLSANFKVETPKLVEPVLTGGGAITKPQFAMTDLSHYNKDIERISDFNLWKIKIQKYCEVDCIALHQVLVKFNSLIHEKWGLNINKYPTIPSLAFAIYRTHYMSEGLIPLTNGQVFDFIKESFTGGSTEMYIPSVPEGKKIYCYDVNSLYPYVMLNNMYPVGDIIQFSGDPTILSPNEHSDYYWIGDVDVTTKVDLLRPYLQIHHNISGKSGDMRTISPNGSFSMKINSPEYYNSLNDYNFSINSGYLFKKENIFSDYINKMYNLRLEYPKTDPMNSIAKLLMNSLYGRFAMKPIKHVQGFFTKEEFLKLIAEFEIEEYIDLNDSTLFVNYIDKNLLNKESKVSISIASAVTAYARVHMSEFKKDDYNLYYTDTDSVYLDTKLSEDKVSDTKLGMFKLENIFNKAVFLGPKIYSGITENNNYINKVKGFKNSSLIPFKDMESLLLKDSSLDLNHSKWFRSLVDGNITIKEQVYLLSKTDKKREFVYNKSNKAIMTKAFVVSK